MLNADIVIERINEKESSCVYIKKSANLDIKLCSEFNQRGEEE